MNKKSELGQFMTTKYTYILEGLHIPAEISEVVEPFAGECDLLKFIEDTSIYTIRCYDIEPFNDNIIQQDTLLCPPNMEGAFILTNPPYLSRNKSRKKDVFDMYNENDLYKCFMRILIESKAVGGILIIPLNFWSSIRKMDVVLRRDFLYVYSVQRLNIFEEQVFSDTTYSVCSFQFAMRMNNDDIIHSHIYPEKRELSFALNDENNYTIGGEIYLLPQSEYRVSRMTDETIEGFTNILVKTIDDGKKIGLSITSNEDRYVDCTPRHTERSYATLVILPQISLEKQTDVVQKFNAMLEGFREKYNSLFLSNYRESNRKRISFDLVYSMVSHLLEK